YSQLQFSLLASLNIKMLLAISYSRDPRTRGSGFLEDSRRITKITDFLFFGTLGTLDTIDTLGTKKNIL
ncbi:MAG: hypothetical protein JXR36_14725, partial [Bacteroidales bacterium]|nr:hypothetical protein [Bacteroidales bacterium]